MNRKPFAKWIDLQTAQSKQILMELIDAKEDQKALLLIANTGLGKTNTIKIFCKNKPDATYKVTVGDSFKLIDVVNAILDELGIKYSFFKNSEIRSKLKMIADNLMQLKADGKKPIIIIDEAENLKPSVLKMIKELYDAIINYCSIVLIGTEQILDSILNRKHKNRQSVPQLWRRFKAGTRYIEPLNKAEHFKPFFIEYGIDVNLQKLLVELADNYGELHDYLEPALIKAAKKNEPLTETLFRLVHKLPEPKLKKVA